MVTKMENAEKQVTRCDREEGVLILAPFVTEASLQRGQVGTFHQLIIVGA